MRIQTILKVLIVGVGISAHVASGQTVQEVRVRWDAYTGATRRAPLPGEALAPPTRRDEPTESFTVLERRRIPGKLPRQRNPELSADQLVIETVNERGETVDTQLIRDPRILRAEGPGPEGEVSGLVLHRADPEFLLTVPDDAGISEVRVYQPRWTGAAYELDFLGAIPLR